MVATGSEGPFERGLEMKRPRPYSREWFDAWKAQHPDHPCDGDEDGLRAAVARGEAERAAITAEQATLRKALLRWEELGKRWHEAKYRERLARERLILLLRDRGRHDEADVLLPPQRQGNERQRAEAARHVNGPGQANQRGRREA
jgi:hypothetical protein